MSVNSCALNATTCAYSPHPRIPRLNLLRPNKLPLSSKRSSKASPLIPLACFPMAAIRRLWVIRLWRFTRRASCLGRRLRRLCIMSLCLPIGVMPEVSVPCRWIGLGRFWGVEWDVLSAGIVDRYCFLGIVAIIDTPLTFESCKYRFRWRSRPQRLHKSESLE